MISTFLRTPIMMEWLTSSSAPSALVVSEVIEVNKVNEALKVSEVSRGFKGRLDLKAFQARSI
jgi:hypothetical protein